MQTSVVFEHEGPVVVATAGVRRDQVKHFPVRTGQTSLWEGCLWSQRQVCYVLYTGEVHVVRLPVVELAIWLDGSDEMRMESTGIGSPHCVGGEGRLGRDDVGSGAEDVVVVVVSAQ